MAAWLYEDQLRLAAEVDFDASANASQVKRFGYGSKQSVPDLMVMQDGTRYRILSDQLGGGDRGEARDLGRAERDRGRLFGALPGSRSRDRRPAVESLDDSRFQAIASSLAADEARMASTRP